MQANYFDYAPTAKWYRNYSHSLHRKRLKDIESKKSCRVDQSEPHSFKILPKLKRDVRAIQKERDEEIQRKNCKILSKLKAMGGYLSSKQLSGPASLNFTSRKRETETIIEENQAMVRRLQNATSTLKKKHFLDEYKSTIRYRENASKKHILGVSPLRKQFMVPEEDNRTVEEPQPEEI